MTTLDLDALERGLEGVTPGPWRAHLVDDTTIVAPDGTDVATTCDSAETEREDGYNIEYERMERDAAHIARCDPDTIRELIRGYRLGLEAERGWQDISTAPEFAEFLAERQTTGDWLKVKRWQEPGATGILASQSVVHAITGLVWCPKRWRPLPTPPAGGE